VSALNRQVLVVEDEFLIAMGLVSQLEDMDLPVCGTAATADRAVELAQRHRPFIVLMDMRLSGDKDGVDAAQTIHATVGSRVIFITGSQDAKAMERIRRDHPFAVLIKPVAERILRETIEAAMAAG
jgi:DNA-binding NarL/FixJ family response regulator